MTSSLEGKGGRVGQKMTSDDMMTLGMGEEADNIPSELRQP